MPNDPQNRILESQPGHLIRRAHQHSSAVFMEETRNLDVTPPQYATLVIIEQNPGIDGATLSDRAAFDRATVGSILDRLEKKGWVVRKPHPHDRRVKENFITTAGKRLLSKMASARTRITSRTLNGLTEPEQKQLLRLLTRLVTSNDTK
ncbi:MAG: MarR family winged helix-turn-helix transcriptional regulator [Alphaproteobacteria bacterium]